MEKPEFRRDLCWDQYTLGGAPAGATWQTSFPVCSGVYSVQCQSTEMFEGALY